jgi:anhydro-N-acetylmuramic acid kinase
MTDDILSIGVNTGNSLDAADVVLTKFGSDGSIEDLDALSEPMPLKLSEALRVFRNVAVECCADMKKAGHVYQQRSANLDSNWQSLDKLIANYTFYVAGAVKKLINRWQQKNRSKAAIDLVGFHGQTCAHQPPSIGAETFYTVQIGNGQLLANEIGIPVVFDFRSDDLMNGGEGAPLAAIHHEHLALHLKNRGKFPIAFCNAGNTGNISVISQSSNTSLVTLGWDTGPFNDYPDKLMQNVRRVACDLNGTIGLSGKINVDLLQLLFDKGAVSASGDNFLLQPPPKSSDPQWYRLLPELIDQKSLSTSKISFEDKLRTCEYFSAYIFFYSLKWIPADVLMPICFILCGGGWNNPVSRGHFEQLLSGNFNKVPILPEHKDIFAEISERMKNSGKTEVALADAFGFSSQYMEARIFADAAVCRIKGIPFTLPQTTGCRTPTVLGIIRFPQRTDQPKVKEWLKKYKSTKLTLDNPKIFDGCWSRAVAGWQNHILKV